MPLITVIKPGVDAPNASLATKQPATTATRTVSHAARAADRELQCAVAALVAALPCEQRAALLLRLHRNLGYPEIAANLRCSPGAARASVYTALRSLRAHVGDRL